MSSEVCTFEFDSFLSKIELENGMKDHDIKTDVIEVSVDERMKKIVGPQQHGSKKFLIYVPNYYHKDEVKELPKLIIKLAKYFNEISDGEVFYYRNSVADEFDELNSTYIKIEEINEYYPYFDDGRPWRYIIKK